MRVRACVCGLGVVYIWAPYPRAYGRRVCACVGWEWVCVCVGHAGPYVEHGRLFYIDIGVCIIPTLANAHARITWVCVWFVCSFHAGACG